MCRGIKIWYIDISLVREILVHITSEVRNFRRDLIWTHTISLQGYKTDALDITVLNFSTLLLLWSRAILGHLNVRS